MPRPQLVCAVCLVSARCRDRRWFNEVCAAFIRGNGNMHCCRAFSLTHANCSRLASLDAQQLKQDAEYNARLAQYGAAIDASIQSYLRVQGQAVPANLGSLIGAEVARATGRASTTGTESDTNHLAELAELAELGEEWLPAPGGLDQDEIAALDRDPQRTHRRGRGGIVYHNGVPLDENNKVAVEDVRTHEEWSSQRAQKQMSAWVLQQARAGMLDKIDGRSSAGRQRAGAIAKGFGPHVTEAQVLRVLRNERHARRKMPSQTKAATSRPASSTLAAPNASLRGCDASAAPVIPGAFAHAECVDCGTSAAATCLDHTTAAVSTASASAANALPELQSTEPSLRSVQTHRTQSSQQSVTALRPDLPSSASSAVLKEALSPKARCSPSKPGGRADITQPDSNPVARAISLSPDSPYADLYGRPFATLKKANAAVYVVAAHVGCHIRSCRNERTHHKTVYTCASEGCTASLARSGMKPFTLTLRAKNGVHMFDEECSQHQHGYMCTAARPITADAGNLPEVQDFLQTDQTVKNTTLLKYLVHQLNFDCPSDIRLPQNGKVRLGNQWVKTMSRIKAIAWAGRCGPEMNSLAGWVKLFNLDADNGYAVIRLRDKESGETIIYDGLSGDPDPHGEFISMSVVFKPTLMACVESGLHSISGDGTFLTVRSDVNMLVCDGICPAADDGLTIVPMAVHLSFAESKESYIDFWQFLSDYNNGIAREWLSTTCLHADRGPGCCMESALHAVFPRAAFMSCAFHVFKAMQRNCRRCIDRKLFMMLVKAPKSTFAEVLSMIKAVNKSCYDYILDSRPDQYCRGHPDFIPSFNCSMLNSVVEAEMSRLSEARKAGKSLLNLIACIVDVVRNVQAAWLQLARSACDHWLMPKARQKTQMVGATVAHYYFESPHLLAGIMRRGGRIQVVSNYKGKNQHHSTYNVTVAPGAMCLADISCDCELNLATTWQIACVHIHKLVIATRSQTRSVPEHHMLAGPTWHVERCAAVFEKYLTLGSLPNMNSIQQHATTGITMPTLTAKRGRQSTKRLVATCEPLTTSSRHPPGQGTTDAAKTFGLEHAIPACEHDSGVADLRTCAYCQAERVKCMMDEAEFPPGVRCMMAYANKHGRVSSFNVLFYEPAKFYKRHTSRHGRPTGQRFTAFCMGARANEPSTFRFDRCDHSNTVHTSARPQNVPCYCTQLIATATDTVCTGSCPSKCPTRRLAHPQIYNSCSMGREHAAAQLPKLLLLSQRHDSWQQNGGKQY